MDVLRFALLGLGAGAIYALLGQGIVLIYRGSGLLNFAQGGIAMISAQIFYGLRSSDRVPTVLAAAIALAVAAAIGAAMQLVVLRRMKNASNLARMMSTLALLGLTEGIGTVAWNANGESATKIVSGILPTGTFNFGDRLILGQDRLVLLILAIVLTVIFWLVYNRTRFGLATSAVAENQQAAVFLGWSPDTISVSNWIAGSLLAGGAGILLSPIAGLSVTALVLTVIPGLAAAMVGQFSSFSLVLVGGLGLGVLQAEMERYVHAAGWADAAPFLVVIALVILKGRALPIRGDILDRPMRVGSGVIRLKILLPVIIGAGVIVDQLSGSWPLAVSSSCVMGIVALSMVLITGYAGQISLTQVTIAGIGAVTAGNLSSHFGFSFVPALLMGAVAAGIVGVLVGLPALRCRGANLAVVTLGLSLVIEEVVFGNQALSGGVTGVVTVGSPSIFGVPLDEVHHAARYAVLTLGVFAICGVAVANLRRGRSGRRLLALRSNERAAATSGVDVYGAKIFAFGLASAIAGLAGALAAFQFQALDLGRFTTVGSIFALLSTVIGGIGYVVGAIISGIATTSGGITQQALSYLHGNWSQDLGLFSAVVSLQVLMFAPSGLSHFHAAQLEPLMNRIGRRKDNAATAWRLGDADPVKTGGSGVGKRLAVRDLSVQFGGVDALSRVSIEVAPGEVIGLIGPNGAGKTTLIDAISGLVQSTGVINIDDYSVLRLSPRQRALRGIGRTYQAVELFDDMSVLDNIRVAAEGRGIRCYVRDLVWPRPPALPSVARAAINDLRLEDELSRDCEELSTGRRRMVGIARTLAGAPGVLLLDEPASGLNDDEKGELARLIRHLADEWNLAILLIEHDVAFVTAVSDGIVALALGKIISEGTPQDVLASDAVVSSYLGEPIADHQEPINAVFSDGIK